MEKQSERQRELDRLWEEAGYADLGIGFAQDKQPLYPLTLLDDKPVLPRFGKLFWWGLGIICVCVPFWFVVARVGGWAIWHLWR